MKKYLATVFVFLFLLATSAFVVDAASKDVTNKKKTTSQSSQTKKSAQKSPVKAAEKKGNPGGSR